MRAGFGLGRLHHLVSRQARHRVIRVAMDAGFRHFDVAPAYGDGLVEQELGACVRYCRGAVSLATKFGIPGRSVGELPTPVYFAIRTVGKALGRSFGAQYSQRAFNPQALVHSLEQSLRRLQTDYVDVFFVHDPLTLAEFENLAPVWDELARQKQRGTIRAFGVSGDAANLLAADTLGRIPSEAVRMLSMCDAVCSLDEDWFVGKEVFAFNVVKHLKPIFCQERIDATDLVTKFAAMLPSVRPLFATNRTEEIAKLGAALGEYP